MYASKCSRVLTVIDTRRLRAWPVLACMVLWGGCAQAHELTPDAGRERDAPSEPADGPGAPDASPSPDARTCVITGPEVCNALDDDCSGLADDGVECGRRRAITTGTGHSCARVGGMVRCWGLNRHGQLGNGTATDSPTAVEVLGLRDVAEIAAGSDHTCARLLDRTVACWGDNTFGQLGDGTLTERWTPVAVTGLSDVVEITAADFHTCARLRDGTVRCWGHNGVGQLGLGDTMDRSTPEEVVGVAGAVSISAGGNAMGTGDTCALLVDGSARCWGQNFSGQLGNGDRLTFSPMPVAVSGLASVAEICAGDLQTCARLSDGSVRCWGDNGQGQLGTGDTTPSPTPAAAVMGLADVAELTSGNAHVCARLTDGTVRCWGCGGSGQLGNGSMGESHTPAVVIGVSNAAGISAGPNHTCAILTDGTVRCWGSNVAGGLGDGSGIAFSAVPVTVLGVP